MTNLITPDREVYVLRSCTSDMRSSERRRHFKWPESGVATAPDWKPTDECGHGLHGFLWGEGDGHLAEWNDDAKWLVVKVIGPYIDLGGKVKFESGEVVFVGTRAEATLEIIRLGALGPVIGSVVAKDGNSAVALTGYRGTATAGNYGTATAGYRGTATAGNYGTATAGEGGTATAGNYGTATAGEGGTATAGNYGTATAGEGGTLQIKRWDGKRYRIETAYVGEDGIEVDKKYRLNDKGVFVPVA